MLYQKERRVKENKLVLARSSMKWRQLEPALKQHQELC